MIDRLNGNTEQDTRTLLHTMLVVSDTLEDFLGGLVQAAESHVNGSGTGILTSVTLLRPRTKPTIAGTWSAARLLADIQYRFDDGPSATATAEGRTVGVKDFARTSLYPLYSSAALRHGIRSCVGVPVPLDGPERATFTYSSPDPGAFPDDVVQRAELFAAEAAMPLVLALRVARLSDRTEQLAAAMTSRTTIDLAVGVVMAQNHCSQEKAISILRAASSARNIKLHDVASSILTSTVDAPVSTHFE